MDYAQFLASKRLEIKPAGFEVSRSSLNPNAHQWQGDIIQWSLRKGRAGVFPDTGLGKALGVNEPVLTADGWKEIGSLVVGESVFGPDGKIHAVIGVFPQGVRSLFRVGFSDGGYVVCDAEHLWAVNTKLRRSRGLPWLTKTLSQIRQEGLRDQEGSRHFIPVPSPVELPDASLPVDPYVLGVILGDGCISQNSIDVSSDISLVESLRLPEGMQAKKAQDICPGVATYRIIKSTGPKNAPNPIKDELRRMGLMGKKSQEKFIPSQYLFASSDQRFALLQGLLDTDGTVSKRESNVHFDTSSKQLALDIQHLIRSLGGTAKINVRAKTPYHHNGELRHGSPSYRMSVRLPGDKCPFRLPRKASKWSPLSKYLPVRSITSIEQVEDGEAVCIKIDAEDGLFIARDFVVTHNTLISLDTAENVIRKTGGHFLLLTPLAVGRQTLIEAKKFNIQSPIKIITGQTDVDASEQPTIHVMNYHKLHKIDPASFVGVGLDEASILKSFGGKVRDQLISTFARTPYRYCFTATPSPNDIMEIGSYAEFLGIMTRSEMLSMFFIHDGGDTSKWRLRRHAEKDFFRWMASWSVMLRKPSDIGDYSDDGYILPPLHYHEHVVETGKIPDGYLFQMEAKSLAEQREARRDSLDDRCRFMADLVNADPKESWSVWCSLNDESTLAAKLIRDCVEITGSQKDYQKEEGLLRFTDGLVRNIVTKASLTGHGLNWQHCRNVGILGISHSFELLYQLIRRHWRYRQEREVNVHLVMSDRDGAILENIKRKQVEFDRLAEGMIGAMGDLTKAELGKTKRERTDYNPQVPMRIPEWLRPRQPALEQ